MRIAVFTLLAAIAIATANATTVSTEGRVLAATEAADSEPRRLQNSLETINFKDIGQGASFNGLKAGEQILDEVNKITKNVDGDNLLAVAKKVAANDKALATADAPTKAIVAALKQVTAKLFPGEQLATVVNRLMPAITAAANAD